MAKFNYSNADDVEDLFQYMAKNNTKEFNFNKAMEEATEFNEALLKFLTKHKDNPKKPTPDDILGEYADFMYRGIVAILVLFPELSPDEVGHLIDSHVEKKLTALAEWRESGKYDNGL